MPLRIEHVRQCKAKKEARSATQDHSPLIPPIGADSCLTANYPEVPGDEESFFNADNMYDDYQDGERKYTQEEWEIPPSVNPGKGCTCAAALRDLVARIDTGEPIIETLPTGVALFDSTTGGLVRGEYAGIIAAPGAGKSTIADLIVLGVLRNHPKASALILNLETSTAVRAARLVAGQSVRFGDSSDRISLHAPIGAMLRGKLRDTNRDHARNVAEALSKEIGGRLRFVDNVHDAEAIGELIRTTRPDVVLVDHLGLVTFDAMPNGSAVDRFDSALHAIADAIRTVNAAGILISELNKLALTEKSAGLSAVRGSARFASLAGMMIGIVRDDKHNGDDPRLLLQLAKNRHGRAGVQQRAILYGRMSYVHFEATIGSLALGAKKDRN